MFEDVSEKTHQAYQAIAERLSCDVYTVYDAFEDNPAVDWYTPNSIARTINDREHLKETVKLLDRAQKALNCISPDVQSKLEERGRSAIAMIEGIKTNADSYARLIESETEGLERRGGKNWAALMIAANLARLFEILEKKATFGHIDGAPTTEFGRAVEYAFLVFDVTGNWREPARLAAALTEKP